MKSTPNQQKIKEIDAKSAKNQRNRCQVVTSIAQVGANMVSKGPSWRQNAFMAAQVHAKVALSDSKLAPIWTKLGMESRLNVTAGRLHFGFIQP